MSKKIGLYAIALGLALAVTNMVFAAETHTSETKAARDVRMKWFPVHAVPNKSPMIFLPDIQNAHA